LLPAMREKKNAAKKSEAVDARHTHRLGVSFFLSDNSGVEIAFSWRNYLEFDTIIFYHCTKRKINMIYYIGIKHTIDMVLTLRVYYILGG
jgi:hypothetical protein